MSMFTLTEEQQRTFDEDGVVCLRGVLTSPEVTQLKSVIDSQVASVGKTGTGYDLESISKQIWQGAESIEVGNADRFDVDALASVIRSDDEARPMIEDDDHAEDGLFYYDVGGWKRHDGIRQVAFDSALPEIIAKLLRSETLNFWEDTTFVKAPHTRLKTPFHQDISYFQISGDQCVIAWIPIDPANVENGVTRYIRGSHKWGETYAPNMFLTQTTFPGAPDQKCPDIEADESEWDIISFDVEPGDVIIHHVMTVHGAGGNLTDRPRRAISFRYTGDNVRYSEKPGALPQPDISQTLPDGARLHSTDYPVVWPKPWPEVSLADLYHRSICKPTKRKRAA